MAKGLPKTFSETLVRKLNGRCAAAVECNEECCGIGWCSECWKDASAKRRERPRGQISS